MEAVITALNAIVSKSDINYCIYNIVQYLSITHIEDYYLIKMLIRDNYQAIICSIVHNQTIFASIYTGKIFNFHIFDINRSMSS